MDLGDAIGIRQMGNILLLENDLHIFFDWVFFFEKLKKELCWENYELNSQ